MMLRFFLEHSETQVGHESKIAEVDNCVRWTPLCDWLREAQVGVRLTDRQHALREGSLQVAPAGDVSL